MPHTDFRVHVAYVYFGWLFAGAACSAPDPSVTTQHNDNFRTGAYLGADSG